MRLGKSEAESGREGRGGKRRINAELAENAEFAEKRREVYALELEPTYRRRRERWGTSSSDGWQCDWGGRKTKPGRGLKLAGGGGGYGYA